MELFFLFIFGAAIGSFLTVVIDRIPRNISIVHGRSFCESCKHKLFFMDLLPIVSYVLLKGKCRYCGKQFGLHYIALEILVGLLFVVTYSVTLGNQNLFLLPNDSLFMLLIYRLLVVCGLFVIFFIDLKHSIIPFSSILYLLLLGLAWGMFFAEHFFQNLVTAACSFLFFFFIHVLTKGKGMGFGDVLYAFVMGLILGFPTAIVGIYIAFLTGAIVSLILILGKRKKLKSAIPFGPFLVFGTVTCFLWGPQLTHAFLVLLHIV